MMDGWETMLLRAHGMMAGSRRIADEGGDPEAVAAVQDAIHAILRVCMVQRNGLPAGSAPTFPTNGREGEVPIEQQIDPIIARLHESGRLDAPGGVAPDTAPVHPFLPPHLMEAYFSNQPAPETTE